MAAGKALGQDADVLGRDGKLRQGDGKALRQRQSPAPYPKAGRETAEDGKTRQDTVQGCRSRFLAPKELLKKAWGAERTAAIADLLRFKNYSLTCAPL